jgi:hypothetical protein
MAKTKQKINGTVVWDGVFDHILVSKISDKDFKIFVIFVELHLANLESAPRLFNYLWALYTVVSMFQPREMASYIRDIREQNAI